MSVQPIFTGSVLPPQPAAQGVAGMGPTASASKVQSVVAGATAAASATAAPAAVARAPSMAELQQALDDVQAVIRPVAQDLLFSIDKDSGRTVVKVVDSTTDKVIRQFPSEEILAIAKALDKFQGLLLKQEA